MISFQPKYMKILKTLIAIAVLITGAVVSYNMENSIVPLIQRDAVLATVNGGDAEQVKQTLLYNNKNIIPDIIWYSGVAIAALLLYSAFKGKKVLNTVAILAIMVFMTGCTRRPFDKPEFVTLETNESGFVIPLIGDISKQVKFDSEDSVKKLQVAERRIQIPHVWVEDGRWASDGHYAPTISVKKVLRTPITVNWSNEGGATKGKDNAIWSESADSIGFSTGFSVTAFIQESDAAKFLYFYQGGTLDKVLNEEVRARIQQAVTSVSANYELKLLREKKLEMIDAIRKDIIPFFSNRGITITTVGMFGGMNYENPKIQSGIDDVFNSQLAKARAEAEFDAQQKKNDTITLAATGKATALLTEKRAEAEGNALVIKSLEQAQNNPNFLSLKQLEVQKALVEKWSGVYPTYFMGGVSSPNMLLSLPTNEGKK